MFLVTKKHHSWLEFLLAMTEKEIKARYKSAVLGFLWVLLNPLLQMIVIGFIFRFFVRVPIENYFLYLFTGLLPWNFFSYSVSKSTPSIVFERQLIKKAKFPQESIPLSIVLSNFFHFIISLLLLLFILFNDKLLLEHYSLGQLIEYVARWIWLIPLVIWLAIFTAGISLLTAALNVKYRDVNFIIQAGMPLWFYATPVIYSLGLIPEQLRPWFYLNPMTAITEQFQHLLLYQPITIPVGTLVGVLMTIGICLLGWRTFAEQHKYFDDWI